ncbi:HTTM domain-containing protein [Microbacterium sp. cx-55]|uniref:HTTM domain-containing protein n=1 Tax=Microbacterium sp. cx-55 TaxID=2875948 RepID=UPI001CBB372A|nr:HTTM domain-containing protein [Microbacterium sp. cx-55]MBZ4486839.1 HTTM domain-containing protein [Microbacterium sp. cx-55]UGB35768.1 HTTM domain-containing protein [Microbacterium sp. cx-55]
MELFDRWARAGSFTAVDVARFRIIYAVVAVLTLPDPTRMASFPDSVFNAPLGPFRLLGGFPPVEVLLILQWALACAIVLLGLGLFTSIASASVTVLLIIVNGVQFSSGKIDHSIIFVLAPVILMFTGWGSRSSLDARLRSATAPTKTPQWPLRLFALVIAIAFASAAIQKLLSGWLSTASQATRGHFIRQFVANGRDEWLTPTFLQFDSTLVWESLDWITVVFEFAFLIAVLNWRAWRIVISVACLFHLGVLLMMNIAFYPNVIAYGAFVTWSVIPYAAASESEFRRPKLSRLLLTFIALAVGTGAWLGVRYFGDFESILGPAIVICGAVLAVAYLIRVNTLVALQLVRVGAVRAPTNQP